MQAAVAAGFRRGVDRNEREGQLERIEKTKSEQSRKKRGKNQKRSRSLWFTP